MSYQQKITIVGTGYVGLVTGACFADWGHEVVCVDIDHHRIDQLCGGIVPIHEPGLSLLVEENMAAARLSFSTDLRSSLARRDAVFIAVGTPSHPTHGGADLSFVKNAAREIIRGIDPKTVIVTKSTVPVGTGDQIKQLADTLRPNSDLMVVSNPEFLREGSALDDFRSPDRLVIGSSSSQARAVLKRIHQPLIDRNITAIETSRCSAELIKYATNVFLATKVAFINEMSDLCEHVGADIADITRGMATDRRIGRYFLSPGPGYGGSCFAKDGQALVKTAQENGIQLRLIEQVEMSNNARKSSIVLRVRGALGGNLANKTVAVLGLTFKANTDDMRQAPSIPLIWGLQRAGATVNAHDPVGTRHARQIFDDVAFFANPYDCARRADALVLMTAWPQFLELDFEYLAQIMKKPILIDFHNVYSTEQVSRYGFTLTSIGKPGKLAPRRAEMNAPPLTDVGDPVMSQPTKLVPGNGHINGTYGPFTRPRNHHGDVNEFKT